MTKIERIKGVLAEIDALNKESTDFDLFLAEATDRSKDGLSVSVKITEGKAAVELDLTTIQNVVNREKNRINNRMNTLEAKLSII